MVILNILHIISIPTAVIAGIIGVSCIVPFAQYLYCRFVKHKQYSIRYYFAQETFDRHLKYDVGLDDTRVIHNRNEMDNLWEAELAHHLP